MDLAIWMSQVPLSKEVLVKWEKEQTDAEQEANRILSANFYKLGWRE